MTDSSTRPFSARLRASTAADLRAQAQRTRQSQSALAERYIDEGLRMDRHPLIALRDGAAGRRPALVGTRLDVWQVVEKYLAVPVAHVGACASYYAEYSDEVDAWIEREHEEADRLEENWRRSRELFS